MGLSNPTVTSLCLARPPHLHEDPAQPRESDLVTKATWSTPAGRSASGGGSGAVVPGQGSEALPSAIFIVCPGWAPAHRRGERGGAVSRQGGRGTKILGKPPAKLDLALPCHYPPTSSCLSTGLRGRDISRRKSRTEDGTPRGSWEGSQGQRRRWPGRANPSPEGRQVYSGGKGSSAVGWSQFSWLQVVPAASMRWNV